MRGVVTGVDTPYGSIEAEFVVNCAGMWARELGALAGVNVPNQAAEHYYLITETNAQTIGWDSKTQFPPYDGQLRLNVYSHLASGANMVAYWHWHSLHYGQETYWKGVLSHDTMLGGLGSVPGAAPGVGAASPRPVGGFGRRVVGQ